jgi:hypothetical protein
MASLQGAAPNGARPKVQPKVPAEPCAPLHLHLHLHLHQHLHHPVPGARRRPRI